MDDAARVPIGGAERGPTGVSKFRRRGRLDDAVRTGEPHRCGDERNVAVLCAGIGNRRGSLVLHAQGFAGMQKRVVIVEGLWPNHAFEEGIGINLLTSADPGLPRGGAVFHDTSVWLRPA